MGRTQAEHHTTLEGACLVSSKNGVLAVLISLDQTYSHCRFQIDLWPPLLCACSWADSTPAKTPTRLAYQSIIWKGKQGHGEVYDPAKSRQRDMTRHESSGIFTPRRARLSGAKVTCAGILIRSNRIRYRKIPTSHHLSQITDSSSAHRISSVVDVSLLHLIHGLILPGAPRNHLITADCAYDLLH